MVQQSSSVEEQSFVSLKRLIILILVVAAVMSGITGWRTWHRNFTDPEHVFWGMVALSLKTNSVTRHVVESDGSSSLDQVTALSLGSQNIAHALTTLTQPGQYGNDTVVTESIGTRSADFFRYRNIETGQRSTDGTPLNFTGIINEWGKSETPELSNQTTGQLLNESVIGVVPFARLSSEARKQLLQLMHDSNLYITNYSQAVHHKLNGRVVYTYAVSLNPKAYVTVLKSFTHALGLTQLNNIDPADYEDRSDQQLEFTVDVLSRQLVSIHYAENNREEFYSGYGQQTAVSVPDKTVPISELQSRLQNLQ